MGLDLSPEHLLGLRDAVPHALQARLVWCMKQNRLDLFLAETNDVWALGYDDTLALYQHLEAMALQQGYHPLDSNLPTEEYRPGIFPEWLKYYGFAEYMDVTGDLDGIMALYRGEDVDHPTPEHIRANRDKMVARLRCAHCAKIICFYVEDVGRVVMAEGLTTFHLRRLCVDCRDRRREQQRAAQSQPYVQVPETLTAPPRKKHKGQPRHKGRGQQPRPNTQQQGCQRPPAEGPAVPKLIATTPDKGFPIVGDEIPMTASDFVANLFAEEGEGA